MEDVLKRKEKEKEKAKVERGVTRELLPQHLDLTWRSKVLLTRGGKFSMQNSMSLILGVNMIQSFLHIALVDRVTITWVVRHSNGLSEFRPENRVRAKAMWMEILPKTIKM